MLTVAFGLTAYQMNELLECRGALKNEPSSIVAQIFHSFFHAQETHLMTKKTFLVGLLSDVLFITKQSITRKLFCYPGNFVLMTV